MNNFLKGSNSKFVVNLFKTFGIACSLVAVQACNENPNNNDKNGEKGGASNGSNNGQKNGEQPSDEDVDAHDADAADAEEETGSNKNNKNGQTGTNNGSGTGSGNGGGSGTGNGTGKGGSNPGGGDATDADAQKKQKITDKITEISNSADWKSLTTLVNGIVGDTELQVEDVFNKIKEKIGGKVYCESEILGFKIDDNAKLIEFLNFCASVEKVFHKNEDYFKFYFKAGDDVNIFIDDPKGNNEFKLDNLEYLVTIENNNNDGLELDDQGKIKLLGGTNEWDSKGDINKIVGFLEGISKMNLGTNFKGLDVIEDKDECGFKIGDLAIRLNPAPDTGRNIEQMVNCWKQLRAVKDSKPECLGSFFENLKIWDGTADTNEASALSTEFCFFGHSMDFKNFFNNNIDLCFNFFNTLFPGKVERKDDDNKIIIQYNGKELSYSTATTA